MAESWLEIAELDRAHRRQWKRGEKRARRRLAQTVEGLTGAAAHRWQSRAGSARIRNHLRDRTGILREELI